MIALAIFLSALVLTPPLWPQLAAVKAEPNLEKRAAKALENANKALKTAQEAYSSGDLNQTQAAVEELVDSVVLANESLKQTGKNPSRSPKHFKRAEIRTRELLRRLSDFQQQMSAEDRQLLERAQTTIQGIHDQLLLGIMSGKKKR